MFYPMNIYFKIQYLKVHCTANDRNDIKWSLKRRNHQQSGREIWIFKKEDIREIQEKKDRKRKRDMMIKRNLHNSIKNVWKSNTAYQKAKYRKTLKCYWYRKNAFTICPIQEYQKISDYHCRIVSTNEIIWWIIVRILMKMKLCVR